MSEQNINWDLFTVEAKDKIWECIRNQRYDDIATVVWVTHPGQEMELQKIKDAYTPKLIVQESKVRAELEKAQQAAGGLSVIDSPEKEAEWQAKLDAEKAEQLAAAKAAEKENAEKKAAVEATAIVVPAEEASPEPLQDVSSEGKPCCGSKGTRHLKTCPEANKA